MRGTYEFYLDVFWITNLIMDMAVLTLTGLLGKERISLLRLLLASAFGATASACLFLGLSSYMGYQLILHFIVNPVTVRISFSWKGPKTFLRNFLAAYVVSVVLGGCVSWLWPVIGKGGFFWLWAAVGVILCVLLIMRGRWKKRSEQVFEVVLVASGQKYVLKGLGDTGNRLWDPMLHRPVHIIEEELFPREVRQNWNVHYIPYQSLGNEKGLLPVIVLEGMYVKKPAGDVQYIEKPACGLGELSLFAGKPYRMILHSTAVE